MRFLCLPKLKHLGHLAPKLTFLHFAVQFAVHTNNLSSYMNFVKKIKFVSEKMQNVSKFLSRFIFTLPILRILIWCRRGSKVHCKRVSNYCSNFLNEREEEIIKTKQERIPTTGLLSFYNWRRDDSLPPALDHKEDKQPPGWPHLFLKDYP